MAKFENWFKKGLPQNKPFSNLFKIVVKVKLAKYARGLKNLIVVDEIKINFMAFLGQFFFLEKSQLESVKDFGHKFRNF